MERESAVREILQSIGPLFPEDAAKARAARKEAFAKAGQPADAAAAPMMTTAPKPMLASQVDNPDTEKTEVATLAAVLERLTPPPPPTSVRDAVPELMRPVVPDVSALRAALKLRDPEPEPAPVVEAAPVAETVPAFTELPADPVEVIAENVVTDAELVEPEDVVFVEPSAAEIQAALAEAIEAQRDPAETAPPAPEPVPPARDVSEAEHDAFVCAIADAILPARPYLPVAGTGDATPVAAVSPPEPVEVATAPVEEPVVVPAPVAAEQPKPKFKRAKPRKETGAQKATMVPAQPAKDPEPEATTQAEPQPVAPNSAEDDELIRQIRVHRDDMVDVDDQIARLDHEIAAEQQAMAHYVSLVEQKNMQRSRLVRLRTNTQRFVETLQFKAEPVKRAPKKQAKSA